MQKIKPYLKRMLISALPLKADRCGFLVFLIHSVSAKRYDVYKGEFDNISPYVLWDQLSFLKENFTILPLMEVLEYAKKGRDLKNCCSITFDDGYKSVAEEAYPALIGLDIPTTIFIVSGNIDDKHYLWRDQVRFIINERLEGEFLAYCHEDYPSINIQRYERETFRGWTRRGTGNNSLIVQDALNGFIDRMGIDFGRVGMSKRACYYLSSSDIKDAPPQVRFGNHTATHPVLTTLSDAQQMHQIEQCRDFLANFSNSVPLFSIPFGRFDNRTIKIARGLGYKGIVMHSSRINDVQGLREGFINRYTMPKSLSDLSWLLLRQTRFSRR